MEIQISSSEPNKRIYAIRGVQVMLDSDLAEIYKVQTKHLKEAVKRNIKRFPGDFMFEASKEEIENLRSQFAISSLEDSSKQHGGSRYVPFAFTEEGVGMLSSVLHSDRAIQVNIEIIRAFVQLRKQPKVQQLDWISKFESLESELNKLRQRFDQSEAQSKNEKPHDPVRMIQNVVARHWGLKIEDCFIAQTNCNLFNTKTNANEFFSDRFTSWTTRSLDHLACLS